MSALMAERAASRIAEAAADAVECIRLGHMEEAEQILASVDRDLVRAREQIKKVRNA